MFTTFCNPTIHCRSQCSLTMALCISTPVLGSRSRLLPLVCPIWKQTLTIYIRGAKMYREGDAKIGTNWNEFSTTKWIIEKNKQFFSKILKWNRAWALQLFGIYKKRFFDKKLWKRDFLWCQSGNNWTSLSFYLLRHSSACHASPDIFFHSEM